MKGTHLGLTLSKLGLLLLAFGLPLQANAQRELIDMSIAPNGAGQSIELKLNQAAPEPSVFALETPPRISIDLPATALNLSARRLSVQKDPVQSMTAVEASGRSRVVISLDALVPYQVRTEGNSVFIDLTGALGNRAKARQQAAASTSPSSTAVATPAITDVDFRRSETGAGRLSIRMNSDAADVDIRNEGGKIVALFRNMPPTDALISRLDVLDFATPVKFVDVSSTGSNGRISITPVSGAEFDQVAYQLGNMFTIELQPLTKAEQEERARAEPQYTGERLNVNFQNIQIRALLQIIADVAGKNMVTSDSVAGEVTLRLENVPWDQALDIVLKTKGLSKSENGNVIWVAPTSEVAEQQKQELEAQQQAEQLAPMVGEIIQVNYAKALDIQALLTEEDSSFLSERGSIAVDERTNVLIVNDTRDKLAGIQSLVRRLDVPVRQVLIESRVVVANDDFNRSVGAGVGATFGDVNNSRAVGASGSLFGANVIANSLAAGVPVIPALGDRLSTFFPASSTGATVPSYGVSILGSDYLVDLELSALQAEGKGEVVSTPRVITADGKEAVIEQGEEIPFTAGGAGAATAATQFKEAVLQLRVKPQITPDDRVIMDLEVSKDSRGDIVPQATGGNAVAIDTSSVNTQVLVNNGETVVLGGIFEQNISETTAKVPLLGDIPLLGFLFRSVTRENSKRELLIFVTPKILSDGIRAN
ncbi:MAG: type IV pilus secretin PilQ [Oceanococcus sp.]